MAFFTSNLRFLKLSKAEGPALRSPDGQIQKRQYFKMKLSTCKKSWQAMLIADTANGIQVWYPIEVRRKSKAGINEN
jgi:hypothetical protein